MKLLYTNSFFRNDYLKDVLNELSTENNISIATPFFTEIEFMEEILKNKGKLRLIVRLCEATSYEALKKIINNENIIIKYFMDREFHSKLYIFYDNIIILGSSNLTNGGLKNNLEINIGILPEDDRYNELCKIFEEYWEEAKLLNCDILEKFNEIKKEYFKSFKKLEIENNFIDKLGKEIIEVEKNKIDIKNNIEFKSKLEIFKNSKKKISEELRKAMSDGMRKAMSKAVVSLTTRKKYESMTIASEEEIGITRGYGYIADVCRGKRKQYKKTIWRFEEDYNKLSEVEINSIINEVLNKKNIEEKEKIIMFFRNKKYEKMEELGQELKKEKIIKNSKNEHTSRNVSSYIKSSEKNGLNFFKIESKDGTEFVYFAKYIQEYENKVKISEEPVEYEIEELKMYYDEIFEYEMGDMTILELLCSTKSNFFKIDNEYYKNFQNLKKDNMYDDCISKEKAMLLINMGQVRVLGNKTIDEIKKATKKIYYIKNNYVFDRKTEYVERYTKQITKEELIKELDWVISIDSYIS